VLARGEGRRADEPRTARGAQEGLGGRGMGARGGPCPCRKAPRAQGSRPHGGGVRTMTRNQMPLWEVFIRPRNGLAHKHCGSVHAADEVMALQAARDVYTRSGEGTSIWVVPSAAIIASDPGQKEENFEPGLSKVYRHPTFYDIPDEVGHM